MRLLDERGKQHFQLDIFLTRKEARELVEQLHSFIKASDPNDPDHLHVFDEEHSPSATAEVWDRCNRFRPAEASEPRSEFLPVVAARELNFFLYDYENLDVWAEPTQEILMDCWGKCEGRREEP